MNPDHPLRQVLQEGDTIGLRYERHLMHPSERVWRALTESEQFGRQTYAKVIEA
jgi:hypothetical protein